jgi:glycosyltransferase involved in cell wall biosynthesis
MTGRERTALIVAGMHRSGTSVTTRIVNLLGADLAGDLIPADIGNERGHWESRAVQALHNRLLAELGSDIYSPTNFPAEWFGSAAARHWIGRIGDLVADEYATSTLFVLKDPRIALFLPLWTAALREAGIAPRFVLPFRHPDAVAASLAARERRLASGNALPHAQGVAVWLRYVLAAERHTRGEARAFVAYDDVLADWRTQFARIGEQLGIAWPNAQHADAAIDAFLDAGADRRRGDDTANAMLAICRDVYASLEYTVRDPQSVLPAFDDAARALAAAESLLGPHIAARERVFDDLRASADAASQRHDAERAEMHERFAAEIDARDARIAEATAHARQLEDTAADLERERDSAVADAATANSERADMHGRFAAEIDARDARIAVATEHARQIEQGIATIEQERDRAVADATAANSERAEMHARFAAEIDARDARIAEAAEHAKQLDDTVALLEREHGNAADYAKSLAHDRDRAAEYATSLKQSLDDATAYAHSLERARDEAAQLQRSALIERHGVPVFFTIASRNYLAYAITLMRSVAEQYPDAPRYLILADHDAGDAALADAPFVTIAADALALPDFDAFAFRYTIMEFNTAIKPTAFAHLRARHPDAGIVYLDPDILVVAPLVEVEAAFADGALAVLTPHLVDPVSDDRQPGERDILVSGTYNCGFVAIGAHADADRLIAWWAQHLEFGAYSDLAAGLFTDQKWIDLVPGLFPDVRILRDEGYNLAYWNLSQRPVSRRGSHWYVGERLLAFVHFSGVDLERPAQFSKHQNRHTQATIGGLRPLYAQYLDHLADNGHREHRTKPYAFGRFADGEPICDPVRAVYRRYFDKGASHPQRQPFSMDRDLYDLPCDELPLRGDAPVTRVMYALWKMRADLQQAFDLGSAKGRLKFVRWFVRTAGTEVGVPERHLEPARRALAARGSDDALDAFLDDVPVSGPMRSAARACLDLVNWSYRFRIARGFYATIPQATRNRLRRRLERVAGRRAASRKPQHGINLVGYAHGEFGVAEVLRRHAHSLASGAVPFVVHNFDVGVASRQSDRSMQAYLSDDCRYDVNLFCINADQMPVARERLGDAVFAGRYNIGCWFWELEKFPEEWHGAIDLVDEIWVTSPFVRDAIAACTRKPVHIVPIALEANLPASHSRREVGLPDGIFVCLYSFDFNSFVARKNAEGAIAAFRRAFAPGRRDVRLVIKTTNGERFPELLQRLIAVAAGDDRIEVRDGFLDRAGMWTLQASCDCYLSLHRSEGLGLGMAECMLLGKPVVATAYSGNLAFMDADNSCLVDYTLIPVKEGEYPAWQGQHWAEPDIEQAAAYLVRLADDADYAREIGEAARASVSRRLSVEASLAAVTARLAQIRSPQA